MSTTASNVEHDSQPLTADEQSILGQVESALASARFLKDWWQHKGAAGGYPTCFELNRAFNPPSTSFGFFDNIHIHGRDCPIMGSVEEMLYDRPKGTPASSFCREFREFVLHYFMRVSDYKQPSPYGHFSKSNVPAILRPLSWCPEESQKKAGFGYSQHFYKLRGSSRVERFHDSERFAIVDLRDIVDKYEWIVVKVRIFDFNLKFSPFGPNRVQVSVPLAEESYLAISADFIIDENQSSAAELGRYGFGYAFLKTPQAGLFAYGPGMFEWALKLITFRVLRNGEIRAHMVFIANRPERILNVSINPMVWGCQLGDLFSNGMFSRSWFHSDQVGIRPATGLNSFDPVSAYVSLANLFTGGWAAEDFCISREQLEKDMLLQHFTQHYELIVGSLLTWRQIPDWLDSSSLPDWVKSGRSA
jgi:hypothetical protein